MITINNYDEMKEYYNEETNTYTFNDNVMFTFDLILEANIQAFDINAQDITAYGIDAWDIRAWNIQALDIKAQDITAYDIDAWDIRAWNIQAFDISYSVVCYAHNDIICNSIKGCRKNSKHFSLEGKVIVYGLEIDE